MNKPFEYYAIQSRMTSPGTYASLYLDLPNPLPALVGIVQGLLVHVFWAERYGLKLSSERQAEVQLRSMEKRLARTLELDGRPLTEPRPLEKKLVGNCRDFSVTLVSMLRHLGIPARARCGFGAYFLPDHYEDHWVAEYWDRAEGRWVLVDAQLDEFQCNVMHIPFNPLDVPRDQFISGGMAWQMCRNGQADPDQFGIFDMHGLGFIRGNLIRDAASLNKVELLPWDCWGLILSPNLDNPQDLAFLDRLAGLTGGVPQFEDLRSLYQTDTRIRVDGEIRSFVNGEMATVKIFP